MDNPGRATLPLSEASLCMQLVAVPLLVCGPRTAASLQRRSFDGDSVLQDMMRR